MLATTAQVNDMTSLEVKYSLGVTSQLLVKTKNMSNINTVHVDIDDKMRFWKLPYFNSRMPGWRQSAVSDDNTNFCIMSENKEKYKNYSFHEQISNTLYSGIIA